MKVLLFLLFLVNFVLGDRLSAAYKGVKSLNKAPWIVNHLKPATYHMKVKYAGACGYKDKYESLVTRLDEELPQYFQYHTQNIEYKKPGENFEVTLHNKSDLSDKGTHIWSKKKPG